MMHIRKMKVTIVITLMFMFLTTHVALAQNRQATVIASEGIVRKSNDFQADKIKTLSRGTMVNVIDEKQDWYQIQSEEGIVEGWMYKDIIVLNDKGESSVKKGITTASVLNVRANASTTSQIITKLNRGTEVHILGTEGQWYQIQLSTGGRAFVHADFVELTPSYPSGRIMNGNANLIKDPSYDGKRIASFKTNDIIYIKGYESGWYHVITENSLEGWVQSGHVELQVNISNPVNRSGTRSHALSDIKSVSEKYLGKRYAYGGNGPNSFDCSGFVSYILNTYYEDYLEEKGINLPRRSRDQANVGTAVNRNQLRTGDLVFFNNGSSSTISHVGIYIGSNQFIHASSGGNMRVIISSLNERTYNSRYSRARRL